VGVSVIYTNTTGSNNTGIGYQALNQNTTASDNTAVGYQALYSNTTGVGLTAVGYQALYACSTSNPNTAVGYQAGNAVTGNDNTLLGYRCGGYNTPLTTGAACIYLGAYINASSGGVTNEITVGYATTGKGASTAFINANSGGTYNGANSTLWSVTSDQRLKKNIVDNTDGLSKITQIRVRNFEYRLPEEITELEAHCAIKKEGVQLGVIAQELQAVLPQCVKQESTGVLSVDADNLTWYLVNAIKELKAEFDAYKSTHP
jgi:hypothetical protein